MCNIYITYITTLLCRLCSHSCLPTMHMHVRTDIENIARLILKSEIMKSLLFSAVCSRKDNSIHPYSRPNRPIVISIEKRSGTWPNGWIVHSLWYLGSHFHNILNKRNLTTERIVIATIQNWRKATICICICKAIFLYCHTRATISRIRQRIIGL